MIRLTSKKERQLKRKIKQITGIKIKDIADIIAFNEEFIDFGVYESNYDKVTNNMSIRRVHI